MVLFSREDRERVRAALLARGEADPRVVAAAVVGSEPEGEVDRFSDVDLTFGVRAGVPVDAVLADWTEAVRVEMDGVDLFDLPVGGTIYRVFLLPGNLQVDLSFSPEREFGATGPRFRLLFGNAVDKPWTGQPDPRELFGFAVHHALRARFAVERGRLGRPSTGSQRPGITPSPLHVSDTALAPGTAGQWIASPPICVAGSKRRSSGVPNTRHSSVHSEQQWASCERRRDLHSAESLRCIPYLRRSRFLDRAPTAG